MLIEGGGLFTLGYLLPLQCFCFVCGTSENKSCSLMQCLVGSPVCVFSANRSFCRCKFKFTKTNFQGFHQSLLSQFCINTHFQKHLLQLNYWFWQKNQTLRDNQEKWQLPFVLPLISVSSVNVDVCFCRMSHALFSIYDVLALHLFRKIPKPFDREYPRVTRC